MFCGSRTTNGVLFALFTSVIREVVCQLVLYSGFIHNGREVYLTLCSPDNTRMNRRSIPLSTLECIKFAEIIRWRSKKRKRKRKKKQEKKSYRATWLPMVINFSRSPVEDWSVFSQIKRKKN
jgi:hypothetical protein